MTICKKKSTDDTDAMLAQLIRRMAQAEGQELLKKVEELNRDDRFSLPEELNARCAALIASAVKEKTSQKKHPVRRVFRFLTAAVLAASLLLITAFATVEEVRLGAWQLLAEAKGDATYYTVYPYRDWRHTTIPNPTDTQGDVIMGYARPEAPEGYDLDLRETFANRSTVRYASGDTGVIELSVTRSGGVVVPPEIDLTDAVPTVIHGYDGSLLERGMDIDRGRFVPEAALCWEDTDRGYWICFEGTNINGQVLLDMALEVQPVDQTRPQVALGYQLPLPPEGFELAYAHRVSNVVSLRYQVMGGDYAFIDVEVTAGDVALPGSLPQEQAREVLIGDQPAQVLTGKLPTVDGSELLYTEIFWCDTHRGNMFSLSSRGVSEEDLLDYARAITYVGD